MSLLCFRQKNHAYTKNTKSLKLRHEILKLTLKNKKHFTLNCYFIFEKKLSIKLFF